MNSKLALLGLSAIVLAGLVCLASKRSGVRILGGFLIGLPSLGCSWLAVFLFQVGAKNNWSSDGPGMLFVMIGIAVAGLLAFLGWGLVFSALTRPRGKTTRSTE